MPVYHVLNRGVEKRDIFLNDNDRSRFVHGLLLFNTPQPAENTTYLLENIDFVNRYNERERIVDVHGWCLMKNHYHLLLSERIEKGITLFLRKLNIGYANYFNKKYERDGSLFQGRTKRIHVNSEAYFLHILNYVHFNPLDYFGTARGWRARRLTAPKQAHDYLMRYRWSSYQDYCGNLNFPSILSTTLFGEKPEKFAQHIFDYAGTTHETCPKPFLLE